jgi:hypothetical protein
MEKKLHLNKTSRHNRPMTLWTALTMAILLQAFTVQAQTGTPDITWYNSGAGPFNISTADQLAGLRQLVNAGTDFAGETITLAQDINLASYSGGAGWTPIGISTNSFSGTFEGDGYVITNLTINNPAIAGIGLFGDVNGGAIKNLGIAGADITNSSNYTGGVAGTARNYSSITNCYVTGAVSGAYGTGGVAGYVESSEITNCYSTATVSGTNMVGGVAGYLENISSITNCYATGAVSGNQNVGGIAGDVQNSSVTNCAALNPQ